MPISVSCDCGHSFRVKDALAGKRVKCPECGATVPVESGDEEFAAAAPRRPRKRAAPAKSSGAGVPKGALIGAGALVVLIVVGAIGWRTLGRKPAPKKYQLEVVENQADWTTPADQQEGLAEEAAFAPFAIRPPQWMERDASYTEVPSAQKGFVVWKGKADVDPKAILIVNWVTPDASNKPRLDREWSRDEKEVIPDYDYRTTDPTRIFKVERGAINGLPYWRCHGPGVNKTKEGLGDQKINFLTYRWWDGSILYQIQSQLRLSTESPEYQSLVRSIGTLRKI